jgi:hypothetical protein
MALPAAAEHTGLVAARDASVELDEGISEDQVIAEFLAAELHSPRHRLRDTAGDLGIETRVIDHPDFASDGERMARRLLAERHTGWGTDDGVCGGLPTETVTWWRARLHHQGIESVEVIQWLVDEYPQHFPARPLGEVRDARLAALPGRRPPEADQLIQVLTEGHLPRPILVTTPVLDRLVILEGHNRMVAYALLGEECPPRIEVIVGLTPEAWRWSEW